MVFSEFYLRNRDRDLHSENNRRNIGRLECTRLYVVIIEALVKCLSSLFSSSLEIINRVEEVNDPLPYSEPVEKYYSAATVKGTPSRSFCRINGSSMLKPKAPRSRHLEIFEENFCLAAQPRPCAIQNFQSFSFRVTKKILH